MLSPEKTFEKRIEPVQVIRLPGQLPGGMDLTALNQRLRSKEVCLDWSDVEPGVLPEHLEVLFDRLNLTEHIEYIGETTIPDQLMPAILAAFETVGAEPDDQNTESTSNEITTSVVAALWLQETETDTGDSTELESGEEITLPSLNEFPQGQQQDTPTPSMPILAIPSPADLREELELMVVRDLLGPAGGPEEELVEDRVRDRYIVGMLAPDKVQTMPEEQDELGVADECIKEDGPVDAGVSKMASLSPCSIGMSFCVDKDATSLLVTARWGHYQREESQVIKTTKGAPRRIWRGKQRGGEPEVIPLKEGAIAPWQPEPEEQPDVFVKGIVRRSNDMWTVTLFLVNGQREPKRLRDQAWLFQPELVVEAPGGAPIFQRRTSEQQARYSLEERSMAMLYRRYVGFAVGHGVSVHAETRPGDPTCAVRLSTRIVASCDVPRTEAPTVEELPALAELVLDMKELAESAAIDLPGKLQPLATAYKAWIDGQALRISDPASGLESYQDAAQDALKQCRQTLERIRQGIFMLANNPDAARAFAFMNRAMWQQRIHTLYAEEKPRVNPTSLLDLDQPWNRSWRPFQLAFIFLNLPALTDLHHPNRSEDPSAIADLLWFPTGGGKTEAYLGLTAYTLAIRRLQGTIEGRSGEDGVAGIMRYTLRLLSLQQFQRASALICACEILRPADKQRPQGGTPFRLDARD